MKKMYGLFLFLFLLFSLSGCKPEEEITALKTYDMDVYLDTNLGVYHNEGQLTFVPEEQLDELYIMFYSNATNDVETMNVEVEYIKINDVEVDFIFTGEDYSAMLIELSDALSEGERVFVDFKYTSGFHAEGRLANYDGILYSMFFFPFVAMKDDTGWNIEPFTFRGETYYNDMGDYKVNINVPNDYMIAAPGTLLESKLKDGRRIELYELKDARDFSFSASAYYNYYTEKIDGITYDVYSVRPLTALEQMNVFGYLEDSFRVYQEYIGPYYYDRFVLELGYIYGMESSGIIYCSENISEGTIVHEVVHQWFFFMIGNDQYDNSFLDESLTTYASSLYYYDKFGMDGYNGMLDGRSSSLERLKDYHDEYYGDSLLQTVDELGGGYGYLIYYHGPTIYRYYVDEFLDGNIERFYEIMAVYYDTYNGKNVSLNEYLLFLESESGVSGTKEWFEENLKAMKDLE